MPLLNISTSKNIDNKKEFLIRSSEFISKLLNKPEKYVMVKLNDSLPMYFSGTSEPSCFIEIKSIGSLNPSEMSREISEFFSISIGIPSERIYIYFDDVNPSMWAWNDRTFA